MADSPKGRISIYMFEIYIANLRSAGQIRE